MALTHSLFYCLVQSSQVKVRYWDNNYLFNYSITKQPMIPIQKLTLPIKLILSEVTTDAAQRKLKHSFVPQMEILWLSHSRVMQKRFYPFPQTIHWRNLYYISEESEIFLYSSICLLIIDYACNSHIT